VVPSDLIKQQKMLLLNIQLHVIHSLSFPSVSGVTTKNIFALMNRLEDLNDLLERSEEELTEILGHSANAKELYESLHGNLLPLDQQTANQKSKSKGTSRFKTNKPKAPSNK